MSKPKKMRPGFEEALEGLKDTIPEEAWHNLKRLIDRWEISPCILCGRPTLDAGFHLPTRPIPSWPRGEIWVFAYGLCGECANHPEVRKRISARIAYKLRVQTVARWN